MHDLHLILQREEVLDLPLYQHLPPCRRWAGPFCFLFWFRGVVPNEMGIGAHLYMPLRSIRYAIIGTHTIGSGQPSATDSPKIPSPEKVSNAASSATSSKGSAGTCVAGKKDAMLMLPPTEVPKAKSVQAKGASGKSMEELVLVSTLPLPSFDGTPVEEADLRLDEEIQRQLLGKAEVEAGAMHVRDAQKKLESMDDDSESFSSSSGEEEEEEEEQEAKKAKMGRTIACTSDRESLP
ncbi:hypothetical protein EI94DRAFT_1702072 [Lactarius quietus]|nr:hypothetical protein EI94DRAFT_1702072 [Lactarius quietus]